MEEPYIYLASPYTSREQDVYKKKLQEQERFICIARVAATLFRKGYHVYSPIVYGGYLNNDYGLPTSWEFWEKHMHVVIPHFSELWVIMMDGWDKSAGVKEEIRVARNCNIPVKMIDVCDVFEM